jgi:transcriptional regulator of acetoin/glycerol metabolism
MPVGGDRSAHRVRDALAQYAATGVRRDDVVRGFVLDSWARCRRNGIDQAKGGPLLAEPVAADELAEQQNDLTEAADPAMHHLSQLLEGCESMALLCGPDGAILKILGDPAIIARGRESRIAEGANWHELASGTNAVGTALALGRPVQIHAAEHFCEWAQPWSCAAALVRDPIDGRTVGVVDVTALSHRFSKQSAPLAQVAATLAEQQIAVLEQQRRARLLEYFIARAAKLGRDGLILLDRRGRIVHADARAQAAAARWAPGTPLFVNRRLVEVDDPRALRSRLCEAMPWLDPDWLEPVGVAGAPLGMLLVLPNGGRRHPSPPPPPVEPDPFAAAAPDVSEPDGPFTPLQRAERAAMVATLRRARGNLSRVARDLGMSRTTLYKRMRHYGLERSGGGWL